MRMQSTQILIATLAFFQLSQATVIFQDDFESGIDFSIWKHEITMGGGGNWEFEYYVNNRSNSYVENGTLVLMPTYTADTIGADEVSGIVPTTLELWGSQPADVCTGNSFYGCSRASGGGNVLNPIQSARLRTAGTFSFKYGRVEVEAKLPKGDWLWPAIWLLPEDQAYGTWPASGEIDIMESRGNAPGYEAGGSDCFGSTLHFGPFYPEDAYEETTEQYCGDDLSLDFHTYGLVWTETEIYTYIDDDSNKVLSVDVTDQSFWELGGWTTDDSKRKAKHAKEAKYKRGKHVRSDMGEVNNPWRGQGNNAPFDQNFYLIFNLAVGGTNGYFPDGEGGKMWTDDSTTAFADFNNALPMTTWTDPSLQIRSVVITDEV
jgi:hypothetical protein